MKNNCLLFTGFCILLNVSVYSQETFVKLFPYGDDGDLLHTNQTSDGNIFTTGHSYEDDTSSSVFIKTDLTGNILWQLLIYKGNTPRFFHEDVDGNYWSLFNKTYDGRYYSSMLELGPDGDSIGLKSFNYPMTDTYWLHTAWLPDDSYFTIWPVTEPMPLMGNSVVFTRTHKSGLISFIDTVAVDIDAIYLRYLDIFYLDGNLYTEKYHDYPWEDHVFDIMKMDTVGSVIDSITIDSIYGSHILKLDDGFIIEGYFDDTLDNTFYGDDRMKIERYDADFNLLWAISDTIPDISRASLALTDDGGFITSVHRAGLWESDDIYNKKYTLDGVLLWSSVIPNEGRLDTYCISSLNDGRFILSGSYATHLPSPNSSIGMLILTDTLCRLNFSRISGKVFYDVNGNELADSSDIGIPEQILITSPGSYYGISDTSGNYSIDVYDDSISYEITTTKPDYFVQSYPDSPFYQLVEIDTCWSYDSVDFAMAIDTAVQDMKLDLHSAGLHLGMPAEYNITITNEGSVAVDSFAVTFNYLPFLVFDSVDVPYNSLVDNTITWNLTDLALFSSTQLNVYLSVPTGEEFLDSSGYVFASVEPLITDITPSDNLDSIFEDVSGAWDPNHKSVEPAGETENGFIDPTTSTLTYTIDFQNTGNYPATFVTLVDTIDMHLDFTTLHTISASHDYTIEFVYPNIVKWHFYDINLPDSGTNFLASQGFVKFEINILPGMPDWTTISNTAGIYFDFNPAVLTNPVVNTLWLPNAIDQESNANSDILIYPNPSSGFIQILNIQPEIISIAVRDITGRIISTYHTNNASEFNIDLSLLEPGIYTISFADGDKNNLQTKKLILCK